jgi:hypothetical protein
MADGIENHCSSGSDKDSPFAESAAISLRSWPVSGTPPTSGSRTRAHTSAAPRLSKPPRVNRHSIERPYPQSSRPG